MFENITIFYTEEMGGNKGVNTAELVKNSICALHFAFRGFSGGTVDKDPPANAGGTG